MQNIPKQYRFPSMIPMPVYNMYPYPIWNNQLMYNMFPYPYPYPLWGNTNQPKREQINLMDYGAQPFVVDIDDATEQNNNFRMALWTGEHLQITLMTIDVGDDIGLEVHTTGDQFINIVDGDAMVEMGDTQGNLNYQRRISDDYVILIPAGKWHNVTNIGNKPLKLYAIYAPPEHPRDTVQQTKSEAEYNENRYVYRY